MEYECYSEEWVKWLRHRLADECGGDWIDDPNIPQRSCPVCGARVDCIPASRVRSYGEQLSVTTQHICLCCGYIYKYEPVALYFASIGHITFRSRPCTRY